MCSATKFPRFQNAVLIKYITIIIARRKSNRDNFRQVILPAMLTVLSTPESLEPRQWLAELPVYYPLSYRQ